MKRYIFLLATAFMSANAAFSQNIILGKMTQGKSVTIGDITALIDDVKKIDTSESAPEEININVDPETKDDEFLQGYWRWDRGIVRFDEHGHTDLVKASDGTLSTFECYPFKGKIVVTDKYNNESVYDIIEMYADRMILGMPYSTDYETFYRQATDRYPHEPIDLGLSIYWASINVGSNSPIEMGGHYAWGETTTQFDPHEVKYTFDSYKWGYLDEKNKVWMKRYITDPSYGTPDDVTHLFLEDDAAHANWGGSWRMPTADEVQELIDECEWEYVDDYYFKITGPNGNHIYMSYGGFMSGGFWENINDQGSYWTNTLNTEPYFSTQCAQQLVFGPGRIMGKQTPCIIPDDRINGAQIRPVMSKR